MKNIKPFNLYEKLVLVDYNEYAKIICDKYNELPIIEESQRHHWVSLIESNNILWTRLISRVNVIFCSEEKEKEGKINIHGKEYEIVYLEGGQPYNFQKEMKDDYTENNRIFISIDYSNHPIFTMIENIIFRTVHDFIVHIQGDYQFGLKGELQSYNLHAKLASKDAVPALFTEIVGQVCYNVMNEGSFPIQKCALIEGVDYYRVGVVDGYDIENKQIKRFDKFVKNPQD